VDAHAGGVGFQARARRHGRSCLAADSAVVGSRRSWTRRNGAGATTHG
jgi:hypothetical protein